MSKSSYSFRRPLFAGLLLGVRLGVGSLFLYSGISKVRRPYDFLENVYDYELSGPGLGSVIAAFVPWFELLLGLCLIAGLFVGAAMLGIVLLTAVFVVVQYHALRNGLNIACGCFGPSDPQTHPIDYRSLWRTVAVLGTAVIGYCAAVLEVDTPPRSLRTDVPAGPSLGFTPAPPTS
jgi:uncharacterized membrane protein YphA (DoxX/SURF4 family)